MNKKITRVTIIKLKIYSLILLVILTITTLFSRENLNSLFFILLAESLFIAGTIESFVFEE